MQYDFRNDWPKIKKQLMEFSQEALTLAKEGEKKLVKYSRTGKLHIDSTALALKREHLCHLIGKEYINAKCPGPRTPELDKLIRELAGVEKDINALKKKLSTAKTGRSRSEKSVNTESEK